MTDNEFVQYRHDLLKAKDGGILTPADPSISPYAPFNLMDYPYINKLGSLDSPAWKSLKKLGGDVINGNPYALSTYRNGYACWDTAVAGPTL